MLTLRNCKPNHNVGYVEGVEVTIRRLVLGFTLANHVFLLGDFVIILSCRKNNDGGQHSLPFLSFHSTLFDKKMLRFFTFHPVPVLQNGLTGTTHPHHHAGIP